MENRNACKSCETKYAQAYVIYQSRGEDVYEPYEALKNGTIFPALNMPYTFWRFNNAKK